MNKESEKRRDYKLYRQNKNKKKDKGKRQQQIGIMSRTGSLQIQMTIVQ